MFTIFWKDWEPLGNAWIITEHRGLYLDKVKYRYKLKNMSLHQPKISLYYFCQIVWVKMYFQYAFNWKGRRVKLLSYQLCALPPIFVRTSPVFSSVSIYLSKKSMAQWWQRLFATFEEIFNISYISNRNLHKEKSRRENLEELWFCLQFPAWHCPRNSKLDTSPASSWVKLWSVQRDWLWTLI